MRRVSFSRSRDRSRSLLSKREPVLSLRRARSLSRPGELLRVSVSIAAAGPDWIWSENSFFEQHLEEKRQFGESIKNTHSTWGKAKHGEQLSNKMCKEERSQLSTEFIGECFAMNWDAKDTRKTKYKKCPTRNCFFEHENSTELNLSLMSFNTLTMSQFLSIDWYSL